MQAKDAGCACTVSQIIRRCRCCCGPLQASSDCQDNKTMGDAVTPQGWSMRACSSRGERHCHRQCTRASQLAADHLWQSSTSTAHHLERLQYPLGLQTCFEEDHCCSRVGADDEGVTGIDLPAGTRLLALAGALYKHLVTGCVNGFPVLLVESIFLQAHSASLGR